MAVTSTLVKTGLNLRYKEGVDQNGKDINKVKKFANIKVSAPDQNLLDTSAALGSLMRYPVTEVVRADESILINE